MSDTNQHSMAYEVVDRAVRYAPSGMADRARLCVRELEEQLEAEAQYRVKAEQAIARLEEAVRVCGRHLYDCCRSDIDWKLQIETHDQAVNAVAWVECDGPREARAEMVRLVEQYKHLENELDDMTGQFCNEAIHLTRAEDRVRELEEQLETLREALETISENEGATFSGGVARVALSATEDHGRWER